MHIHSVLSPDADELMTPNNILNMAMLKELDFVAITDHNSTKQLNVIDQIEVAYDFIIIPGVEVTVKENFDALCYFRTYKDAYALDKLLEKYLTDDFGPFSSDDQMITDIYDTTISTYPRSLTKTTIPYNLLYKKVKELNGIIVLAHIERSSKSALNFFELENLKHDGVEIQQYKKKHFIEQNEYLLKEKILTSSDSHSLLTISEREHFLDLKEKSIDAFFNYFEGSDICE